MKQNKEIKFLEGTIKLTLFIMSIIILILLIKFDIFEKETFAYIIGVLVMIGLMDVVDTLVKIYKVIVLEIENKGK